MHLFKTARL